VSDLFVSLPEEVVEALVEQVADLVLKRLGEQAKDGRVWLSVEHAAAYLDLPAERLRKLIGRRELPFYQEAAGHRILLNARELDDWLAASRHAPRGGVA
jgi:excisionase family DNA binding protein